MIFKDYYNLLGLETTRVSIDEIKSAYRIAAKKYHPDLNIGDDKAEEKIKDINEAYRILSVPSTKRKYDRTWNSHNIKMKQKEFFLTSEGYLELETELNYLKTDKRNEVLNSLKEARALGDLSENAEYDSAREEQGKLEARIKEVEYILEHATIIDDAQTEKDKVTIGSTVSLQYDGDDEVEEYRIVGSQEADPFNNKISNESPIAMAILGKKVGQMAEVESPNGTYKVKIVKVA